MEDTESASAATKLLHINKKESGAYISPYRPWLKEQFLPEPPLRAAEDSAWDWSFCTCAADLGPEKDYLPDPDANSNSNGSDIKFSSSDCDDTHVLTRGGTDGLQSPRLEGDSANRESLLTESIKQEARQIRVSLRPLLKKKKKEMIARNRQLLADFQAYNSSSPGQMSTDASAILQPRLAFPTHDEELCTIDQLLSTTEVDAGTYEYDPASKTYSWVADTKSVWKAAPAEPSTARKLYSLPKPQRMDAPTEAGVVPSTTEGSPPDHVSYQLSIYRPSKRRATVSRILPAVVIGTAAGQVPKFLSWMSIPHNLRYDDNAVMRFVPYFGDDDTTGVDVSHYDVLPDQLAREMVSEVDEKILGILCRRHPLSLSLFRAIGQALHFPPHVLQKRFRELVAAQTRWHSIRTLRQRQPLHPGLRFWNRRQARMLAGNNFQTHLGHQVQQEHAATPRVADAFVMPASRVHDTVNPNNDIADSVREMFCRRCLVFDCRNHGIQHVLPRQRFDPDPEGEPATKPEPVCGAKCIKRKRECSGNVKRRPVGRGEGSEWPEWEQQLLERACRIFGGPATESTNITANITTNITALHHQHHRHHHRLIPSPALPRAGPVAYCEVANCLSGRSCVDVQEFLERKRATTANANASPAAAPHPSTGFVNISRRQIRPCFKTSFCL